LRSEFFRAVLCGELFAEQTQYLQVADFAFNECDGGAQRLATLQHTARVTGAQLSARADGRWVDDKSPQNEVVKKSGGDKESLMSKMIIED
jgi:hypothetical protein